MANEIQLSVYFVVSNGYYKDTINTGLLNVDQAAIGRGGHVQSIGTTEEVVDLGDVVTNGILFLRNLSTTDYVVYGPEDSGAMVVFGKLKPGEVGLMRIAPTVVVRAKAMGSQDVPVDVRLYED